MDGQNPQKRQGVVKSRKKVWKSERLFPKEPRFPKHPLGTSKGGGDQGDDEQAEVYKYFFCHKYASAPLWAGVISMNSQSDGK